MTRTVWMFGVILTLCSGTSVALYAQHLGEFNKRHFTNEHGLPSKEVHAVFQDSKGYIWMTTDHGLCRYNGYAFETFSTADGLANNTLFKAVFDSKGNMWIVGLNNTLTYYDGHTFHAFARNDLLHSPMHQGLSLAMDASDTLWYLRVNKNGINELYRVAYPDYLEQVPIRDITGPPKGNCFLWPVQDQYLCLRYVSEDGQYHDSLAGKPAITKAENGIWLNVKHPISKAFQVDDTRLVVIAEFWGDAMLIQGDSVVYKMPTAVGEGNELNGATWAYASGPDEVWVGRRRGLDKYTGYFSGTPHTEHFMPNEYITHVTRDQVGNYWISTGDNGCFMAPDLRFRTLQPNAPLSANHITSIRQYEGALYMGDSKGQVYFINDSQQAVALIDTAHMAPSWESQDFHIDRQGRIWCGDLMTIYNPETKRTEGEVNNLIRKIIELKDGHILMAYYNGFVMHEPNGKVWFSNASMGYDLRTNALLQTTDGRIWLGNTEGLFELHDGAVVSCSAQHPLLHHRVLGMDETPDGRLLLASKGQGLLIRSEEEVRQVNKDQGLVSDFARCVFAESDTRFWVGTNLGLSRVDMDPHTGNVSEIVNYSVENGLPDNEINDVLRHGEYLWLATSEGACYFDPASIVANSVVPKALITTVKVNNREAKLPLNELRYDQNNVSIGFLAINVRTGNRTRYRYRLLGQSAEWSYTTARDVQYVSLPPGSYTFEVAAMNEDGVWNEAPTPLAFSIHPHFSETRWFRIVATALLLLVVAAAIALVIRNSRRKAHVQAQFFRLRQQALSASMNPHFIFNALNSIQDFILQNEHFEANEFLASFSRLIRLNLEISQQSFVSLADELERLQLYLSLEKLRFEDKLRYEVHVHDSIDQRESRIPVMILQPFVENAIWHGILPKQEGGTVCIHIQQYKQEYLLIDIIDDGVGLQTDGPKKRSKHNSLSIKLTQERLNMLAQMTGRTFSVSLHDHPKSPEVKGTHVRFVLSRPPTLPDE